MRIPLRRNPVKIDLILDAPLVKMNYSSQFDRILRGADRENIHSIWEWLHCNSFETYLGGGTIERLFDSARPGKYTDIDLLATYDKIENFSRLGRELALAQSSAMNKDSTIRIGRREFSVDWKNGSLYLNFNGIERFILSPSHSSQSPIDISFFNNKSHSQ